MNQAHAEKIANAVLYEGYILYPYRPSSVKNRQRWTFGGVFPRAYSEAQAGGEPWAVRAEWLVRGGGDARLSGCVRFLRLIDRAACEVDDEQSFDRGPTLRPVPALRIGE